MPVNLNLTKLINLGKMLQIRQRSCKAVSDSYIKREIIVAMKYTGHINANERIL
jgi:hypothetical protein